MTEWLDTILTGGLISGIVFAIRQEGRINSHDQLFQEREKQADERYEDTTMRLQRIESHLLDLKRNGHAASDKR